MVGSYNCGVILYLVWVPVKMIISMEILCDSNLWTVNTSYWNLWTVNTSYRHSVAIPSRHWSLVWRDDTWFLLSKGRAVEPSLNEKLQLFLVSKKLATCGFWTHIANMVKSWIPSIWDMKSNKFTVCHRFENMTGRKHNLVWPSRACHNPPMLANDLISFSGGKTKVRLPLGERPGRQNKSVLLYKSDIWSCIENGCIRPVCMLNLSG